MAAVTSATSAKVRAVRALLWMNADQASTPGGHQVQMQETARHLAAYDVDVQVTFEARPDLTGFDIVHGFELGAVDVRYARSNSRRVVMSTIYRDRQYLLGEHAAPFRARTTARRAKTAAALAVATVRKELGPELDRVLRHQLAAMRAFESADRLLPNSMEEAHRIVADLGVTTPFSVVPNAVNPRTYAAGRDKEWEDRDGVVFAGRFEPHKNQLGLLEALANTSLRLTLVGPPHPAHPSYFERCLQHASERVRVLGPVTPEKLAGIFSRARVHALPSWFESPGLVSLEAAASGCNVVTTSRGYVEEYFEKNAWYCDPADPSSIRRAVVDAHSSPFLPALADRVLLDFTWDAAARATATAYRTALRV